MVKNNLASVRKVVKVDNRSYLIDNIPDSEPG